MKPLFLIISSAAVTGAVAVGGYTLVAKQNEPKRWEYTPPAQTQIVEATEEAEEIVEEERATEEPKAQEKTVEAPPPSKPAGATLSGSYRCWSFNVDGAGGRCTSPPIVFSGGGAYSMSSESGNYTVSGSSVTLSESKIRGVGTLSEDKAQLAFHYFLSGKEYYITYLKQ